MVKVSAAIAAVSAQAPAAVGLSTAVALAPKDILKYPEQVHQDEVVTTYAASAGTQEGAYTIAAVGERPTAFAPTTSPEEIMNSNKSADVAPWRTDLMTRIKERFKVLDMELDAKAAARREQTVQVERKNVEKQAVLQNELVKTADIEKEKGNQTLTVETVTSKPELDYRKQKTEQTQEVREQAEKTVETAVQAAQTTAQLDVNEPELNCVERIQQ